MGRLRIYGLLVLTFLIIQESKSQCDARFSYSIDTVKNDVYFISVPDSTATRFWYLNNQLVSNESNHVITLPYQGSYTILQTVVGNQCKDSFEQRIILNQNAQCYADYQVSLDQDTAYFQFTGFGSRLIWDFGDGNFSMDNSPVHSYNVNPGTVDSFLVRLIANANQIVCSDTIERLIIVSNPQSCVADFTHQVLGDSVQFTALDTTATQYSWDFGDGSSGTGPQIVHTYRNAGDYTVQLVVENSTSQCVDSASQRISILSMCQAKFKLAVDTSISYKLFLINESTEFNGDRYLWEFGDGSTSTDRNPVHVYQQFGKFNICLSIVNDNLNCAASFCLEAGMDKTGRLLKNGAFELWVLEDDVLHVNQLEDGHVMAFPNPFNHELQLQLEVPAEELEIRNVQGVVVYKTGEIERGKTVIDGSKLTPGMYWVLVRTKGYRRVIKVLKQ